MNVGINGRIYTPATCHSHPLFSSVQCLLLVRNTGCTSWTCGTGSYRGCDGLGEDLQKELRSLPGNSVGEAGRTQDRVITPFILQHDQ